MNRDGSTLKSQNGASDTAKCEKKKKKLQKGKSQINNSIKIRFEFKKRVLQMK